VACASITQGTSAEGIKQRSRMQCSIDIFCCEIDQALVPIYLLDINRICRHQETPITLSFGSLRQYLDCPCPRGKSRIYG
jgi:hypothetical protein